LQAWATELIEAALTAHPDWFDGQSLRSALSAYLAGSGDSSFYIWQWISAGQG
jgi:hypothetical protein